MCATSNTFNTQVPVTNWTFSMKAGLNAYCLFCVTTQLQRPQLLNMLLTCVTAIADYATD